MKLIRNLIATCLLLTSSISFAQHFQGELNYMNYYVDPKTLKPLFEAKPEIVFIKNHLEKIDVKQNGTGGLDWTITDFDKKIMFSAQNYENAPIMRDSVCTGADTTFTYELIDTTFIIANLVSKVMVERQHGELTAVYYYCTDITLPPSHYSCNRTDGLDRFYRLTKGALITQLYLYGDGYTCIRQLADVKTMRVPDAEFELPKGEIVNRKN